MAEKKNKYRNPANDLVDASVRGARRAGSGASAAARRSVRATSAAAARTSKKEKAAQEQTLGYAARKKREAAKNKPAPKPAAAKPKQGDYKSRFAGARDEAFAKARNIKPTAPKTQEPPASAQRSAPRATAVTSGGGRGASATPPASRPTSSAKSSPASESYRDGGKGLYQGSAEYRAKVGGSGNPLLNRFRKDMGRDEATGAKMESKPTEKKSDPQVGYTPKTKVDGSKYGGGKAAKNRAGDKNPDVASKATNKYLEEIEKRRKGQSNVIG